MSRRWILGVAALVALVGAFAGAQWGIAAPVVPDREPRIIVLGTVQDGGMPQVACSCVHCAAARRDPALRRHVASLAIDFPRTDHTDLVDATPDLGDQLERLRALRPHPRHPTGGVDRLPVDGVFLTHAHIGHYLGLAFFGFESLNSQGLPTYCSPRMAQFLRANGPWSQLVRLENIALHEFEIGKPLALEERVTVTAIQVPHRDEYTDTMAFLVRGPHKSLLYVPDTDGWASWPTPVTEVLRGVDYALVDGTFYSPDELPDRDVSKIKHPLITVSMDLLQPLVAKGLGVYFTHLNHSNPALDADGPARKAIQAKGFHVLGEHDEFPL